MTARPGDSDQQPGAVPPTDAAELRARVGRYLRFLGCESQVLDDLVQDTMLAATRYFASAAAPWPWLLTTARNMLRQHHRKHGHRREVHDIERLHDCYGEQMRDDGGDAQLQALRECLQELPARSRRIVELRYGDGLQRQAIADEVGLGLEGVKSVLAKVRAQLGECIRKRTEG